MAHAWIIEHFGSLDSELADPHLDADGDGRTNLAEFLFGSHPLEPDAPYFVAFLDENEEDGQRIFVEFRHRETDAFAFSLESSDDLVHWSSFAGDIDWSSTRPDPDQEFYQIRTIGLRPAAGFSGQFYRIHAKEN